MIGREAFYKFKNGGKRDEIMKLKLIIISACIYLLLSPVAWADSSCDHVTIEWIKSHVPVPDDTTIVFKQSQNGLCEAVLSIDGGLAPVYAGKDFLVAGRLFKKGKSITRETMASLSDVAKTERRKADEKEALAVEQRKEFFKSNVQDLSGLVSMTFAPGDPKDFVYVITDPNCTHCKALLNDLEILSVEAGIALKLIIYPVLGIKSQDMAAHAICNEFSYGAYKAMSGDDTVAVCEKADELIGKTKDLFKSADISFVPIVVAKDGAWVVEGNDICEIRTHLGLQAGDQQEGSGSGCSSDGKE